MEQFDRVDLGTWRASAAGDRSHRGIHRKGVHGNERQTSLRGGGSIGCEIGLELAEQGKNVSILELTDTLAANANSLYREALRQKFLQYKNLHSLLKCGCSRIEEDVVVYKDKKGEEKSISYDNLILSTGLSAQKKLVEAFYGICKDTIAIGDCISPSNIMNANFEGFAAGLNI